MRIHILVNPKAGRGRAHARAVALAHALTERGATVTSYETRGPGDARDHIASLVTTTPTPLDRLVVVGGDGTLHEVVNGAGAAPLPWPVALVPLGTANLVARDAGIPLGRSIEPHVRTVLTGTPWTVDLLGTDRGRALAVLGAGLDASVVRAVAQVRRGGTGGYARWVLPIARTFVEHRASQLVVEVDGIAVEGGAVVIQNTHCYGGLFTLSPRARMDDGWLDVVVLRQGRRRDHFRLLVRAFTRGLSSDRGVVILRGRSVTVSAETPVDVHADGDPAGITPLRATLLPGALTLLH